jgi:hypothetical protein
MLLFFLFSYDTLVKYVVNGEPGGGDTDGKVSQFPNKHAGDAIVGQDRGGWSI